MRKYLVAAALGLGVTLSSAGCASTWWQNFVNDPVQGVQSFESAVQIAVSGAQLAWPAVLSLIPQAAQAEAQKQFTLAVAAVNHALQALNDSVTAAMDLKQPSPNFGAAMQAVSDAVAAIIAIVDQYKAPSALAVAKVDGGASDAGAKAALAAPPGYDDMKAAYASLKHYGVKVK